MGLPPAAPLCPDSTSLRCNSVTVLDLGGRVSQTIDVYGVVTAHYFDLDSHEVRTVANYDDGVYDSGSPDTDIVTSTSYDLDGGVVGVTDVLGRVTSTQLDVFGRATKVIRPDSSWIRTHYVPSKIWAAVGDLPAYTSRGLQTWKFHVAMTLSVRKEDGHVVTIVIDREDRSQNSGNSGFSLLVTLKGFIDHNDNWYPWCDNYDTCYNGDHNWDVKT